MTSAVALVFALLTLIGDVVSDQLRWAAVLAGVGLLVFRITTPDGSVDLDTALRDRTRFGASLPELIQRAKEVWIFAPSAVNVLSEQNCQLLRSTVLDNAKGVVRIVVQDPGLPGAVADTAHQLDDGLDYPLHPFPDSLAHTISRLRTMAGWPVTGSFGYRLFPYNPGFSLVAIDPGSRHGVLIVEFHGVHSETTASRMHLELTRSVSDRWYSHWITQFDHIWSNARKP